MSFSITLNITILAAYLYLVRRLLWPLPYSRKRKLTLSLLLLLISQYHFITRCLGGNLPASPELPFWFLLTAGGLFDVFFLLCFFTLGRDLLALSLYLPRKLGLFPASAILSFQSQVLLITIISLLLGGYGLRQALKAPSVKTLEITLPQLPPALDGLSLAYLTDLHICAMLSGSRIQKTVDQILALRPDIILCGGDLVDGLPAFRAEAIKPLEQLTAPYGVWGCVGNHEYYADFAAWTRIIPQLGLRLLSNRHQVLMIKGQPLVLLGITDQAAARQGLPGPNLRAALAGSPEKATRILLAHRPWEALANARAGIDLQLSGHTHGGQMLIFDRIVALANQSFVRGLYQVENMRLYVSSGAGLWSGFPLRLGAPSEVTHLILRSPAESRPASKPYD